MEELKVLNFEYEGKVYQIKFPNVGTFTLIESLKQRLSAGTYSQMIGSLTESAGTALDMIDLEAYLSTLCPELIADLEGVDSIRELSLFHFVKLKKAYDEQFTAWWNKVLETLKNPSK